MTSETRYRLVLHREAARELRKLPKPIRAKAKELLEQLPTEPIPRSAAKLKGRANAYRIRLGDYRVLYEVHATEIVIYVFGISHRREVYQRILPRR